jgi:hypothetical protein
MGLDRAAGVSESVLEALARALQLDEAGTRRLSLYQGRPACSGVSLARLEVRNSRISLLVSIRRG